MSKESKNRWKYRDCYCGHGEPRQWTTPKPKPMSPEERKAFEMRFAGENGALEACFSEWVQGKRSRKRRGRR